MDFPETSRKPIFENTLPLVNIVFLLLIFFMIAGSFSNAEILNIQAPKADFKEKIKEQEIIILMNTNNELAIKNHHYSKEEIIKFIQKNMEKSPNLIIQIKADQKVKSKNLIEIIEALSSMNIKFINLVTKNKNTH